MSGRRLKLKTQKDFIQRLSSSPPLEALAELIWNALDESSTNTRVTLTEAQLGRVTQIQIADNGNSLPFEKAAEAFSSLGGSNKVGRYHTLRASYLNNYTTRICSQQ